MNRSQAENGEATEADPGAGGVRYVQVHGAGDRVGRAVMTLLTRLGISVRGSRVLRIRGRRSGEWRSTPVNLLTLDGVDYLVAPRGHTQWVRNLRAAGVGELRLGRRTDVFVADELPDAAKPAILRAYLRRWKFEVGMFFDGIDADATDAELLHVAPGYPVFRITR